MNRAGERSSTSGGSGSPPRQAFKWALLIPVLLLGAALAYAAWHLARGDGPKATVGQSAPELTLADLDGQTFHLSNYRGRVIVLNFFTSWCPPCQQEAPELARFARSAGPGTVLVMVDRGEAEGPVRRFIQKYGIDAHVVMDPDNRASQAFGVTGQPETFIIDRQGIIRQHVIGPTTANGLEQMTAPWE
ncbi:MULTISPECIES: TlpA family protein disulfide reductase [Kyrpidia]|uniref:TlpA family protein disulfide reductase n=2 Tax=Kyrpidia spormannii TaxID=2055160 RepID=A0A6F9EFZ3_9BACL|nr:MULTISPECIES: TlpA disulfide reductase family protein [Kyrpidia]MCL6575767.1 TlpA family protein disulfide reductase [Kyrpidia sp.]CAB3394486.1 TlpA family protein disulfide reductase [Kyrpidia spormannii]CAB3395418.1 TlpA family protein disulfide reductase [Kyrpidia spormannii]HHY66440.1 TlpA family protein disulfide reductase [Alicyclobacillus sp.]